MAQLQQELARQRLPAQPQDGGAAAVEAHADGGLKQPAPQGPPAAQQAPEPSGSGAEQQLEELRQRVAGLEQRNAELQGRCRAAEAAAQQAAAGEESARTAAKARYREVGGAAL